MLFNEPSLVKSVIHEETGGSNYFSVTYISKITHQLSAGGKGLLHARDLKDSGSFAPCSENFSTYFAFLTFYLIKYISSFFKFMYEKN